MEPRREPDPLIRMADNGAAPGGRELLETDGQIPQTRRLHSLLNENIVGQPDAVDALVRSFARVLSRLRDTSRPVLTALSLGPTGVGKSQTARTLAQALFGSESALTVVNAQEYSQGHEIAKLLGSPPGYVGYDIDPLLSQQRIDSSHKEAVAQRRGFIGQGRYGLHEIFSPEDGESLSIILFDEVEKASPLFWNTLLGILEEGSLTLGNNQTTDFTRAIILLTSNVGSREMSESLKRRSIGFQPTGEDRREETLSSLAAQAATRVFPPEFLNRLDEVLVYTPLTRKSLDTIFDRMLQDVHRRLLDAGYAVLIRVEPEARDSIVSRAARQELGARPLRRLIESQIVDPIARLAVSSNLHPGDVVRAELKDDSIVFSRPAQATGLVA